MKTIRKHVASRIARFEALEPRVALAGGPVDNDMVLVRTMQDASPVLRPGMFVEVRRDALYALDHAVATKAAVLMPAQEQGSVGFSGVVKRFRAYADMDAYPGIDRYLGEASVENGAAVIRFKDEVFSKYDKLVPMISFYAEMEDQFLNLGQQGFMIGVEAEYYSAEVLTGNEISQSRMQHMFDPVMHRVEPGRLDARLDATSPAAKVATEGSQITAASYKFTATGDSFILNDMRVRLADPSASVAVSSAILRDGPTFLAQVPFDEIQQDFHFSGFNTFVPENSTKSLSVNFVLALGVPGTPLNVKPVLSNFQAVDGSGDVAGTGAWAEGNDILVYQSFPTFTSSTSSSAPIVNGNLTSLYGVKVAASPSGDVALKQLAFSVNVMDTEGVATLENFKFFMGSVDATSMVSIKDGLGNDLETGQYGLSDIVYVTFATEMVVPAGYSSTLTLKATPQGFDPGDSVSTVLVGDKYPNGEAKYLAELSGIGIVVLGGPAIYPGNFIWSDLISHNHSSTPNSSSGDWNDGYLIHGLGQWQTLTVLGQTSQQGPG